MILVSIMAIEALVSKRHLFVFLKDFLAGVKLLEFGPDARAAGLAAYFRLLGSAFSC